MQQHNKCWKKKKRAQKLIENKVLLVATRNILVRHNAVKITEIYGLRNNGGSSAIITESVLARNTMTAIPLRSLAT